jgi:hypothetical protein
MERRLPVITRKTFNRMFLAYGAGGIIGPHLAGFMKPSSGSYMGMFPFVLAFAVIDLVIAYALMKPPKPITWLSPIWFTDTGSVVTGGEGI